MGSIRLSQHRQGPARLPATPATSRTMRAVRMRGTAPENELSRGLRRAGMRFRTQYPIVGKPDIAFPRQRLAVFVDGAFWHGRSWKSRGYTSLEAQFANWRNGDWWLEKVRANLRRDHRQTRQLRRRGWSVVRVTDDEIARSLDRAVSRVARRLSR
jgi:DNA mismatch endonuclease, patch repair protein